MNCYFLLSGGFDPLNAREYSANLPWSLSSSLARRVFSESLPLASARKTSAPTTSTSPADVARTAAFHGAAVLNHAKAIEITRYDEVSEAMQRQQRHVEKEITNLNTAQLGRLKE